MDPDLNYMGHQGRAIEDDIYNLLPDYEEVLRRIQKDLDLAPSGESVHTNTCKPSLFEDLESKKR